MIQFGRAVSLQVFNMNRSKGGSATIIDSREVRSLRVRFHIEKNLESVPNNATIEVYNLGDPTLAFFERKNGAVQLRVGYNNNAPLKTSTLQRLFLGDIAKVSTTMDGPDRITKIEAGDGEWAYMNQNADLSFGPGANVGQVLDKLMGLFGLGAGVIQGVNRQDSFVNGLSVSGAIRKHMDKICKRQNVEWSIQDGKIQIIPFNKAAAGKTFVLSPSSGLVGVPFKQVVLRPDLIKSAGDGDLFNIESGSKINALLNPQINPGSAVQLNSKRIKNLFRCGKTVHDGDTHGKNWYTTIEGRVIA